MKRLVVILQYFISTFDGFTSIVEMESCDEIIIKSLFTKSYYLLKIPLCQCKFCLIFDFFWLLFLHMLH
jgi:hypothetical protein